MRNIKPFLALGAALCVGSAGISFAQDQTAPPATSAQPPSTAQHVPDPHRQAKRMAEKLGLTPDQESKIEPILAARDQQIQSLRADTTLAPPDKKAKFRGIRQDSDNQIEALLTDTQKQQYEQMKQSHKGRQHQTGASSNS